MDLINIIEKRALSIRRNIINVAALSKTAHVGSSLSCVDILASCYFGILNIDKNNWDNRDIFILSKGHAALCLYCSLYEKGLLSLEQLEGYMQNNGTLPAHLDRFCADGIEVSAGSLGHGFNIGLGMAYSYKLSGDPRKVIAVIGDGENQEGSIWEGALFSAGYGLDNFTVFVDHNNLQGYGRPLEICAYADIVKKWQSFGWDTISVDGHNISEILDAFNARGNGKPRAVICNTTKGKGVSFMEDELKWHYYIVTEELKEKALEELV